MRPESLLAAPAVWLEKEASNNIWTFSSETWKISGFYYGLNRVFIMHVAKRRGLRKRDILLLYAFVVLHIVKTIEINRCLQTVYIRFFFKMPRWRSAVMSVIDERLTRVNRDERTSWTRLIRVLPQAASDSMPQNLTPGWVFEANRVTSATHGVWRALATLQPRLQAYWSSPLLSLRVLHSWQQNGKYNRAEIGEKGERTTVNVAVGNLQVFG